MPFLCLSSLVYCLRICWVVAAEAEVLFQSNSLLLRNLDLRVLGKSDPPKTEIKQFQVKIMDETMINPHSEDRAQTELKLWKLLKLLKTIAKAL